MKRRMNRREFLKSATTATGAAVLAAVAPRATFGQQGGGTSGEALHSPAHEVFLPLTLDNSTGGCAPDIVFHNGAILTMDQRIPRAQALAVTGEKITAVGSDAEVLALRGSGTQAKDLGGLTIMPGFVDPHTHVLNTAYQSDGVVESAQNTALENGVTSLANMYCVEDFLSHMQAFDAAGKLRVRTSLYLNYTTNCGDIIGDWYKQHPPTRVPGEMLRIGGVKLFTDGGSCGGPAYSYDHPFFGYGDLWFSEAELNSILADIDAAGYQAAIHALGDRAVEQALNAIEHVLDGAPNNMRHRIEHNAVVRDDMLGRHDAVGAVALIHPTYPACTGIISGPPAGYESWEWRWRDLIDSNPGTHFAWHGDRGGGPVTALFPASPLFHLYSLVTSHEAMPDGSTCDTPAWISQKTITLAEAIPMFTIEAAYALFRDDEVGSLTPGKYADLIILSADPTAVDPEEILNIKVLVTMVGGKMEYVSPDWEEPPAPGTWRDDFSSSALDSTWSWVAENPSTWSLTDRPGYLRIHTHSGPVGDQNLLLRGIPATDYDVKTRVLFEPTRNFQLAGVVFYQDAGNYLMLGRAFCSTPPPGCAGNAVYFDRVEGGTFVGGNHATPTASQSEVYLRVVVRDRTYTGYYSDNGTDWTLVGSHTPSAGVDPGRVGLTAAKDLGGAGLPADFDFLELRWDE